MLVHDLEADVPLPVVEHTLVQEVHDTLHVLTRRQQQRAQRSDGDIGQRSGAQGACKRGSRLVCSQGCPWLVDANMPFTLHAVLM